MLLEYKFLKVNKVLLIVTFTTICHDKLRKSAGIRVLLGKTKTKTRFVHCLSLEEGMAIHFSILGWRITWREEPGGLQSTGS